MTSCSTRRDFFRWGAAAAVGGIGVPGLLGSGLSVAAAQHRWTMRLSTSSSHFASLPIEKACERIAALGFEAIDIWAPLGSHQYHLDDVLKRLGPNGLKEVLAENRLKLCAFTVYMREYPRYAELLGKVGGGVAVRSSSGHCDPKELTSRMKSFLEELKPELELAEKYDSYLAIENHGHALLSSLDSFKAFVDLNKNPRLGIALAPYHLQAQKASVKKAIAIAGKQLFFFYAWERTAGGQALPGHGQTDYRFWLAALAKIGYRWYVNPFTHAGMAPEPMSAALAKSRDYLKNCYANIPQT